MRDKKKKNAFYDSLSKNMAKKSKNKLMKQIFIGLHHNTEEEMENLRLEQ